MIINTLRNYWRKYKLEIIVGASILGLILYAISRIGEKGTFNKINQQKINDYSMIQPTSYKKIPKINNDSKFETNVRQVLKNIFNKPFSFEKIRPDFLNNSVTGANLEIDCYCAELNLGVEAQGIQHYKYTPYFHKSKETFRNQQYRDVIKRQLCKDNGIKLLEVPYNVKPADMETFLRTELRKLDFRV
jgi:hypothetical protein